jgi:hypothetical protein
MNVGASKFLELAKCPLLSLVKLGRAGQSSSDPEAKVVKAIDDLAVILALVDDASKGGRIALAVRKGYDWSDDRNGGQSNE